MYEKAHHSCAYFIDETNENTSVVLIVPLAQPLPRIHEVWDSRKSGEYVNQEVPGQRSGADAQTEALDVVYYVLAFASLLECQSIRDAQ